MSVNLIFKIAAVGIIVSVLSQVLKHSGREEHAFLISLAGLMVVLFWVVPYIYELFETMQSLFTFYKRGEGMDVLKIAAFAVSGVFLAMLLKQTKPEYSVFLSMAVCIGIFLYLLSGLSTVLGYLKQLQAQVHIDGTYLDTILKMLGITYITQFASDLCRDAGYSAISSQMELFARVSVLFLSFPVLLALVEMIGEVL